MVAIVEATTASHLAGARKLFIEFFDWMKVHHEERPDLFVKYYDSSVYAEEVAGLPGEYGPPGGKLLVALDEECADYSIVGCVGLRDMGDGICEMKRMFVPESFNGQGLGRILANSIVRAARGMGYRTMRLDTGVRQAAAITLYSSLGFEIIEAYYEVPPDLDEILVFMELSLED